MERLGIEFLTGLGMPPVQFVELAADLGCHYISLALGGSTSPVGYPTYNLMEDSKLRGEMLSAMRARGVSVSLGEGIMVMPGADIRDRVGRLEVMREFGVTRANVVSLDPDLSRTFDQFAFAAELAADAGMEMVTEFAPALSVRNLATAVAAVRHVGRPDFRLLIDTMHLVRSGGTTADLAALDPNLIGYVQLSDAPLVPTISDYMEEATRERLAPGRGELPLFDILNVLPRNLAISLEVPEVTKALSGTGPHERVGAVVEAARKLLARLTPEPESARILG